MLLPILIRPFLYFEWLFLCFTHFGGSSAAHLSTATTFIEGSETSDSVEQVSKMGSEYESGRGASNFRLPTSPISHFTFPTSHFSPQNKLFRCSSAGLFPENRSKLEALFQSKNCNG